MPKIYLTACGTDGMGDCEKCDRDDAETHPHTVFFFDSRGTQTWDLCPVCVREIANGETDDNIRAVT